MKNRVVEIIGQFITSLTILLLVAYATARAHFDHLTGRVKYTIEVIDQA